jgi:hypothetical protein
LCHSFRRRRRQASHRHARGGERPDVARCSCCSRRNTYLACQGVNTSRLSCRSPSRSRRKRATKRAKPRRAKSLTLGRITICGSSLVPIVTPRPKQPVAGNMTAAAARSVVPAASRLSRGATHQARDRRARDDDSSWTPTRSDRYNVSTRRHRRQADLNLAARLAHSICTRRTSLAT